MLGKRKKKNLPLPVKVDSFYTFPKAPRPMAYRHHELGRIRTGDSIRQGPWTPLEAREREYVMKGMVTTAVRSSSRHPSRPSAVHGGNRARGWRDGMVWSRG